MTLHVTATPWLPVLSAVPPCAQALVAEVAPHPVCRLHPSAAARLVLRGGALGTMTEYQMVRTVQWIAAGVVAGTLAYMVFIMEDEPKA